MQILKDEIKEAILNVAMGEFELKGYGKASMRRIASGCGITVGNLYRYFSGKDALFEALVSPAFRDFLSTVDQNNYDDGINEKNSIPNGHGKYDSFEKRIREYGEAIVSILTKYRRELILLYDGSAGSRFESARETILIFIEKQLHEHILLYMLHAGVKGYEPLARIIAASYIEGFFDIIRNFRDNKIIRTLALNFNSLFWNGFGALLKVNA